MKTHVSVRSLVERARERYRRDPGLLEENDESLGPEPIDEGHRNGSPVVDEQNLIPLAKADSKAEPDECPNAFLARRRWDKHPPAARRRFVRFRTGVFFQ